MSGTGEATVDPDGTTTFEETASPPPVNESAGDEGFEGDEEEILETVIKGMDPVWYLIFGVVIAAVLVFLYRRRKKANEIEDDFFSNLDVEKFNLKLPSEVDEYDTIKAKCEDAGWDPTERPTGPAAQSNGPHRVLAQALMKRAIADIPIVTHIQKESAGMNRLYSQSMCSVTQWRSYQAAEQLVSAEVEEVRTEADLVEPGWSQVIWRQAMQYHQMLKERHEQETKQVEEATRKRQENITKLSPEEEKKQKEAVAEKAAAELIKDEERKNQSKKAFSGSGLKKGFLDKNSKKK
mmetsp:Transcript_12433/g.16341  ORF Transcript_12433/g.16341 Transcript_12433/m.16341 type:complete len:294 (+) Transcript_12433:253-1134(+)|eukprot:CAMPEP_0198141994 /NCGR_PEP_ID=MMETSP1443-20131203/4898_1 /TAXON_ID=186043 /ORGANISM="Entomoneis sp., Strain CCMP2396" /LENGTH=293 /DNA_ID=CAMNT_0043804905 /DNA_START=162 /DNA_END=1043 /DNA_ORIENTATION=-